MAQERKKTGGTREFVYSQKDNERIRNTDTKSSKEFKQAYKQMQIKRMQRAQLMYKLGIGVGIFLIFIIIIIIWKLLGN